MQICLPHDICRVHPSLTCCPLHRSAAFSVDKGFGFITIDGEDRDVFVHHSDIYAREGQTPSLAEGEAVEFRIVKNGDDYNLRSCEYKAVKVTGPKGAHVQGALSARLASPASDAHVDEALSVTRQRSYSFPIRSERCWDKVRRSLIVAREQRVKIAQEELDTALKETAESETKAKLDAVRAEDDEPEK